MEKNSAQYSLSRERRIERFMTNKFRPGWSQRENACGLFHSLLGNKNGVRIMTYFIFARDGTSRIVLKRDTREAAEKKARELKDLGWFDVQIEQTAASQAA